MSDKKTFKTLMAAWIPLFLNIESVYGCYPHLAPYTSESNPQNSSDLLKKSDKHITDLLYRVPGGSGYYCMKSKTNSYLSALCILYCNLVRPSSFQTCGPDADSDTRGTKVNPNSEGLVSSPNLKVIALSGSVMVVIYACEIYLVHANEYEAFLISHSCRTSANLALFQLAQSSLTKPGWSLIGLNFIYSLYTILYPLNYGMVLEPEICKITVSLTPLMAAYLTITFSSDKSPVVRIESKNYIEPFLIDGIKKRLTAIRDRIAKVVIGHYQLECIHNQLCDIIEYFAYLLQQPLKLKDDEHKLEQISADNNANYEILAQFAKSELLNIRKDDSLDMEAKSKLYFAFLKKYLKDANPLFFNCGSCLIYIESDVDCLFRVVTIRNVNPLTIEEVICIQSVDHPLKVLSEYFNFNFKLNGFQMFRQNEIDDGLKEVDIGDLCPNCSKSNLESEIRYLFTVIPPSTKSKSGVELKVYKNLPKEFLKYSAKRLMKPKQIIYKPGLSTDSLELLMYRSAIRKLADTLFYLLLTSPIFSQKEQDELRVFADSVAEAAFRVRERKHFQSGFLVPRKTHSDLIIGVFMQKAHERGFTVSRKQELLNILSIEYGSDDVCTASFGALCEALQDELVKYTDAKEFKIIACLLMNGLKDRALGIADLFGLYNNLYNTISEAYVNLTNAFASEGPEISQAMTNLVSGIIPRFLDFSLFPRIMSPGVLEAVQDAKDPRGKLTKVLRYLPAKDKDTEVTELLYENLKININESLVYQLLLILQKHQLLHPDINQLILEVVANELLSDQSFGLTGNLIDYFIERVLTAKDKESMAEKLKDLDIRIEAQRSGMAGVINSFTKLLPKSDDGRDTILVEIIQLFSGIKTRVQSSQVLLMSNLEVRGICSFDSDKEKLEKLSKVSAFATQLSSMKFLCDAADANIRLMSKKMITHLQLFLDFTRERLINSFFMKEVVKGAHQSNESDNLLNTINEFLNEQLTNIPFEEIESIAQLKEAVESIPEAKCDTFVGTLTYFGMDTELTQQNIKLAIFNSFIELYRIKEITELFITFGISSDESNEHEIFKMFAELCEMTSFKSVSAVSDSKITGAQRFVKLCDLDGILLQVSEEIIQIRQNFEAKNIEVRELCAKLAQSEHYKKFGLFLDKAFGCAKSFIKANTESEVYHAAAEITEKCRETFYELTKFPIQYMVNEVLRIGTKESLYVLLPLQALRFIIGCIENIFTAPEGVSNAYRKAKEKKSNLMLVIYQIGSDIRNKYFNSPIESLDADMDFDSAFRAFIVFVLSKFYGDSAFKLYEICTIEDLMEALNASGASSHTPKYEEHDVKAMSTHLEPLGTHEEDLEPIGDELSAKVNDFLRKVNLKLALVEADRDKIYILLDGATFEINKSGFNEGDFNVKLFIFHNPDIPTTMNLLFQDLHKMECEGFEDKIKQGLLESIEDALAFGLLKYDDECPEIGDENLDGMYVDENVSVLCRLLISQDPGLRVLIIDNKPETEPIFREKRPTSSIEVKKHARGLIIRINKGMNESSTTFVKDVSLDADVTNKDVIDAFILAFDEFILKYDIPHDQILFVCNKIFEGVKKALSEFKSLTASSQEVGQAENDGLRLWFSLLLRYMDPNKSSPIQPLVPKAPKGSKVFTLLSGDSYFCPNPPIERPGNLSNRVSLERPLKSTIAVLSRNSAFKLLNQSLTQFPSFSSILNAAHMSCSHECMPPSPQYLAFAAEYLREAHSNGILLFFDDYSLTLNELKESVHSADSSIAYPEVKPSTFSPDFKPMEKIYEVLRDLAAKNGYKSTAEQLLPGVYDSTINGIIALTQLVGKLKVGIGRVLELIPEHDLHDLHGSITDLKSYFTDSAPELSKRLEEKDKSITQMAKDKKLKDLIFKIFDTCDVHYKPSHNPWDITERLLLIRIGCARVNMPKLDSEFVNLESLLLSVNKIIECFNCVLHARKIITNIFGIFPALEEIISLSLMHIEYCIANSSGEIKSAAYNIKYIIFQNLVSLSALRTDRPYAESYREKNLKEFFLSSSLMLSPEALITLRTDLRKVIAPYETYNVKKVDDPKVNILLDELFSFLDCMYSADADPQGRFLHTEKLRLLCNDLEDFAGKSILLEAIWVLRASVYFVKNNAYNDLFIRILIFHLIAFSLSLYPMPDTATVDIDSLFASLDSLLNIIKGTQYVQIALVKYLHIEATVKSLVYTDENKKPYINSFIEFMSQACPGIVHKYPTSFTFEALSKRSETATLTEVFASIIQAAGAKLITSKVAKRCLLSEKCKTIDQEAKLMISLDFLYLRIYGIGKVFPFNNFKYFNGLIKKYGLQNTDQDSLNEKYKSLTGADFDLNIDEAQAEELFQANDYFNREEFFAGLKDTVTLKVLVLCYQKYYEIPSGDLYSLEGAKLELLDRRLDSLGSHELLPGLLKYLPNGCELFCLMYKISAGFEFKLSRFVKYYEHNINVSPTYSKSKEYYRGKLDLVSEQTGIAQARIRRTLREYNKQGKSFQDVEKHFLTDWTNRVNDTIRSNEAIKDWFIDALFVIYYHTKDTANPEDEPMIKRSRVREVCERSSIGDVDTFIKLPEENKGVIVNTLRGLANERKSEFEKNAELIKDHIIGFKAKGLIGTLASLNREEAQQAAYKEKRPIISLDFLYLRIYGRDKVFPFNNFEYFNGLMEKYGLQNTDQDSLNKKYRSLTEADLDLNIDEAQAEKLFQANDYFNREEFFAGLKDTVTLKVLVLCYQKYYRLIDIPSDRYILKGAKLELLDRRLDSLGSHELLPGLLKYLPNGCELFCLMYGISEGFELRLSTFMQSDGRDINVSPTYSKSEEYYRGKLDLVSEQTGIAKDEIAKTVQFFCDKKVTFADVETHFLTAWTNRVTIRPNKAIKDWFIDALFVIYSYHRKDTANPEDEPMIKRSRVREALERSRLGNVDPFIKFPEGDSPIITKFKEIGSVSIQDELMRHIIDLKNKGVINTLTYLNKAEVISQIFTNTHLSYFSRILGTENPSFLSNVAALIMTKMALNLFDKSASKHLFIEFVNSLKIFHRDDMASIDALCDEYLNLMYSVIYGMRAHGEFGIIAIECLSVILYDENPLITLEELNIWFDIYDTESADRNFTSELSNIKIALIEKREPFLVNPVLKNLWRLRVLANPNLIKNARKDLKNADLSSQILHKILPFSEEFRVKTLVAFTAANSGLHTVLQELGVMTSSKPSEGQRVWDVNELGEKYAELVDSVKNFLIKLFSTLYKWNEENIDLVKQDVIKFLDRIFYNSLASFSQGEEQLPVLRMFAICRALAMHCLPFIPFYWKNHQLVLKILNTSFLDFKNGKINICAQDIDLGLIASKYKLCAFDLDFEKYDLVTLIQALFYTFFEIGSSSPIAINGIYIKLFDLLKYINKSYIESSDDLDLKSLASSGLLKEFTPTLYDSIEGDPLTGDQIAVLNAFFESAKSFLGPKETIRHHLPKKNPNLLDRALRAACVKLSTTPTQRILPKENRLAVRGKFLSGLGYISPPKLKRKLLKELYFHGPSDFTNRLRSLLSQEGSSGEDLKYLQSLCLSSERPLYECYILYLTMLNRKPNQLPPFLLGYLAQYCKPPELSSSIFTPPQKQEGLNMAKFLVDFFVSLIQLPPVFTQELNDAHWYFTSKLRSLIGNWSAMFITHEPWGDFIQSFIMSCFPALGLTEEHRSCNPNGTLDTVDVDALKNLIFSTLCKFVPQFLLEDGDFKELLNEMYKIALPLIPNSSILSLLQLPHVFMLFTQQSGKLPCKWPILHRLMKSLFIGSGDKSTTAELPSSVEESKSFMTLITEADILYSFSKEDTTWILDTSKLMLNIWLKDWMLESIQWIKICYAKGDYSIFSIYSALVIIIRGICEEDYKIPKNRRLLMNMLLILPGVSLESAEGIDKVKLLYEISALLNDQVSFDNFLGQIKLMLKSFLDVSHMHGINEFIDTRYVNIYKFLKCLEDSYFIKMLIILGESMEEQIPKPPLLELLLEECSSKDSSLEDYDAQYAEFQLAHKGTIWGHLPPEEYEKMIAAGKRIFDDSLVQAIRQIQLEVRVKRFDSLKPLLKEISISGLLIYLLLKEKIESNSDLSNIDDDFWDKIEFTQSEQYIKEVKYLILNVSNWDKEKDKIKQMLLMTNLQTLSSKDLFALWAKEFLPLEVALQITQFKRYVGQTILDKSVMESMPILKACFNYASHYLENGGLFSIEGCFATGRNSLQNSTTDYLLSLTDKERMAILTSSRQVPHFDLYRPLCDELLEKLNRIVTECSIDPQKIMEYPNEAQKLYNTIESNLDSTEDKEDMASFGKVIPLLALITHKLSQGVAACTLCQSGTKSFTLDPNALELISRKLIEDISSKGKTIAIDAKRLEEDLATILRELPVTQALTSLFCDDGIVFTAGEIGRADITDIAKLRLLRADPDRDEISIGAGLTSCKDFFDRKIKQLTAALELTIPILNQLHKFLSMYQMSKLVDDIIQKTAPECHSKSRLDSLKQALSNILQQERDSKVDKEKKEKIVKEMRESLSCKTEYSVLPEFNANEIAALLDVVRVFITSAGSEETDITSAGSEETHKMRMLHLLTLNLYALDSAWSGKPCDVKGHIIRSVGLSLDNDKIWKVYGLAGIDELPCLNASLVNFSEVTASKDFIQKAKEILEQALNLFNFNFYNSKDESQLSNLLSLNASLSCKPLEILIGKVLEILINSNSEHAKSIAIELRELMKKKILTQQILSKLQELIDYFPEELVIKCELDQSPYRELLIEIKRFLNNPIGVFCQMCSYAIANRVYHSSPEPESVKTKKTPQRIAHALFQIPGDKYDKQFFSDRVIIQAKEEADKKPKIIIYFDPIVVEINSLDASSKDVDAMLYYLMSQLSKHKQEGSQAVLDLLTATYKRKKLDPVKSSELAKERMCEQFKENLRRVIEDATLLFKESILWRAFGFGNISPDQIAPLLDIENNETFQFGSKLISSYDHGHYPTSTDIHIFMQHNHITGDEVDVVRAIKASLSERDIPCDIQSSENDLQIQCYELLRLIKSINLILQYMRCNHRGMFRDIKIQTSLFSLSNLQFWDKIKKAKSLMNGKQLKQMKKFIIELISSPKEIRKMYEFLLKSGDVEANIQEGIEANMDILDQLIKPFANVDPLLLLRGLRPIQMPSMYNVVYTPDSYKVESLIPEALCSNISYISKSIYSKFVIIPFIMHSKLYLLVESEKSTKVLALTYRNIYNIADIITQECVISPNEINEYLYKVLGLTFPKLDEIAESVKTNPVPYTTFTLSGKPFFPPNQKALEQAVLSFNARVKAMELGDLHHRIAYWIGIAIGYKGLWNVPVIDQEHISESAQNLYQFLETYIGPILHEHAEDVICDLRKSPDSENYVYLIDGLNNGVKHLSIEISNGSVQFSFDTEEVERPKDVVQKVTNAFQSQKDHPDYANCSEELDLLCDELKELKSGMDRKEGSGLSFEESKVRSLPHNGDTGPAVKSEKIGRTLLIIFGFTIIVFIIIVIWFVLFNTLLIGLL